MVLFGAIALAANLTCLALLYRFRDRDVNMSSTFECSRNDVIANIGVLLAAAGEHVFGAGWPDIVVGAIIAVLFVRSAIKVIAAAYPEWKSGHPRVAVRLEWRGKAQWLHPRNPQRQLPLLPQHSRGGLRRHLRIRL
jgi:Co/Zn/Cd efflux system component